MQVKELIKYIHQPELLDKDSVQQLRQLVQDFPYFQSGHILLSLAARRFDASLYQQSIKKTAIVVNNREHLFHLIHSPLPETEAVVGPAETVIAKNIALPVVEKAEEEKVDKTEIPVLSEDLKNQEESAEIVKITEETVEQEIEKALVNSFVEKEILKTHQAGKTEAVSEPASFADWLRFMKKNNGQPYLEIARKVQEADEKQAEKAAQKAGKQAVIADDDKTKKAKLKQKAIIDKIIDTNPGVIRQKEDQKFFKSDQKAKESLLENEHLVTETLAQIYALQGNTGKAIRAYEILSLKFPQKSAYFASLIEKLKQNQ